MGIGPVTLELDYLQPNSFARDSTDTSLEDLKRLCQRMARHH